MNKQDNLSENQPRASTAVIHRLIKLKPISSSRPDNKHAIFYHLQMTPN